MSSAHSTWVNVEGSVRELPSAFTGRKPVGTDAEASGNTSGESGVAPTLSTLGRTSTCASQRAYREDSDGFTRVDHLGHQRQFLHLSVPGGGMLMNLRPGAPITMVEEDIYVSGTNRVRNAGFSVLEDMHSKAFGQTAVTALYIPSEYGTESECCVKINNGDHVEGVLFRLIAFYMEHLLEVYQRVG